MVLCLCGLIEDSFTARCRYLESLELFGRGSKFSAWWIGIAKGGVNQPLLLTSIMARERYKRRAGTAR